MAVDSRSFQPSRIGFGSICGAPLPAGRIWKFRCGPLARSGLPTRPRSVPATTRAPVPAAACPVATVDADVACRPALAGAVEAEPAPACADTTGKRRRFTFGTGYTWTTDPSPV